MRTGLLIILYFAIAAAGIWLSRDWVNGLPTITAGIFGITVSSGALVAALCTEETLNR